MNLQQLEYIVALDKHKSFSKAAEACYITQATLSTMVKRLEEELGLVIFDRKSSPIITTDCGQDILKEAKAVLYHSHRLKEISADIKGRIEGELKIGIIPTVASNLLHRILPVLITKYPALQLNVQEITTANIIRQLKSGELDAGIVSTPLHTDELEEDVLYYEKLMVYGKVKQSNTKYLKTKDMAHEKMWLLEQGNCLTDQIINVCSLNTKKVEANFHFNPNSFESLLNIVDSFQGLTLIPELFYADLSEERKANVRNFHTPYPVREISMVYHRPYAKRRLIDAISKEIKELVLPLLETSKLNKNELTIAEM